MKNRKKRQGPFRRKAKSGGFALVAVLLVAVLLMTLLGAMSTLVMAETRQVRLQGQQRQAYDAAEAGLEMFMSALVQAANNPQGLGIGFPYTQVQLDNLVQNLPLQRNTQSVRARYVKEDGQPAYQIPPYPHLIEVTSTGTVQGVSKTIVAIVDLQYLEGIFQYAVAAAGSHSPAIQFQGNPSVSVNVYGSVYVNGDIQTNNKTGFPSRFRIFSGQLDLGPQAGLDASKIPSTIPYRRLPGPMAFPTFQSILDGLKQRIGAANTLTISTSAGYRYHLLFKDLWGEWRDLQLTGSWLDVPSIGQGYFGISGTPINNQTSLVVYSSPASEVIVVGNPEGKTIVSTGNLHVLGPDSRSQQNSTLYVSNSAADLSLPDGLNYLGWLPDLLYFIYWSDSISCYIYAPNGTVTLSNSSLSTIYGGVAAQTVEFEPGTSITIDARSHPVSDFSPTSRPELFLPQPVIIKRVTQ